MPANGRRDLIRRLKVKPDISVTYCVLAVNVSWASVLSAVAGKGIHTADLTLTLLHTVHCALCTLWRAAHALYQGVLYSRNVTRLAWTNLQKLTSAEQHYVERPSTDFHPNRTIKAESASYILYTSLSNVRGTPDWFLQNSETLKNFCGRTSYLILPNRTKDVKITLKICLNNNQLMHSQFNIY